MTELYTSERALRCRRRAVISLAAACALVIVCWGVCALLCARVRTANAAALFRWVLGLSVLSGWAAILTAAFVFRPARAETRHMESLRGEAAEEYEGVMTLSPEAFQIPRGIRVRKATLQTEAGPVSLRLDDALAAYLPANRPLRVRTVRQYITAFEVLHEKA